MFWIPLLPVADFSIELDVDCYIVCWLLNWIDEYWIDEYWIDVLTVQLR
jgi:hypothetical protein